MRELERRLANLEQYGEDATVRQISDLIDELSAQAAGGDVGKSGNTLDDLFDEAGQ